MSRAGAASPNDKLTECRGFSDRAGTGRASALWSGLWSALPFFGTL